MKNNSHKKNQLKKLNPISRLLVAVHVRPDLVLEVSLGDQLAKDD